MAKQDLVQRLASQVGDKGMAVAILKKRGDVVQSGKHLKLTAQGAGREKLGAEGRAKDRAAKKSGHKTKDYTYSKATNRATLKGKK